MKGISADQKTRTTSDGIKLKAISVRKDIGCSGCWFQFSDPTKSCIGEAFCVSIGRKDGKNIIWVEADK